MKKIQNRNKSLKTNASRRLASYVSAGVCVSGTSAWAAIEVTFYPNPLDFGSLGFPSDKSVPSGINRGFVEPSLGLTYFRLGLPVSDLRFWSQGAEIVTSSIGYGSLFYSVDGAAYFGAARDAINYANISFSGNPDGGVGDYEAVGKFYIGTDAITNPSQLLAIATDTGGGYLPIPTAVAAIDAAAVPEPSGMLLGLLALGSSACARRRARPVRG